MPKKIGGKNKVDKVKGTERAAEIEKAESVGEVQGVAPTSSVKGVGRVSKSGSASAATRTISKKQREELLNMIKEEAKKMAQEGALPDATKEVAEEAVIMAVDTGLMVEDDQ